MLNFLKTHMPYQLKAFLGKILYAFAPDKAAERFCAHNKNVWNEDFDKSNGVIIYDSFPIAQTILTISYFLNILGKKHKARFRPFSHAGMGNPITQKIYASFGAGPEIITRVKDRNTKSEVRKLSENIYSELKTKEDVFNIKVKGYAVGIDIYESYLRFCGMPTVYIEPKLLQVIREAVELVFFWEDFYKRNNVCALVLSHSCYNHLNIPAKVAYQKKIPVYIPYSRGIYKVSRPFEIHGYFPQMRTMFSRLSVEEQTKAKELSKRQLARRLSGEVGVDMPYSTKTGYVNVRTPERMLAKNEKIKVLIASHCFYDNPYAYGDLLFIDFYEWISFLGKLAEETDYDWYLKMHPDPFPGTEETMKQLLKKYPRIRMVPKETSHLQLVEEGLNFVLTAYGSVGHEYPALGVQVINAGYNPREAYGFNWNPKTVDEYKKLLLDLPNLKLNIDLDELYEFYYMYHYYVYAQDFLFKDIRETEKAVGGYDGLSKTATYDAFLAEFTPERHQEIQKKMADFIESDSRYFFSKGPEKI